MGKGRIEAADITWKTVAYGTLTHGGLILFVILYTVIGGLAFRALEGPHERQAHDKDFEERNELRIKFINRVRNMTSVYFDEDINIWDRKMVRYTKSLERRLGVAADEDFAPKWTFYGSLFFSGVVISTIGYGNIAPVTVEGRVFCMIYAVFGIALLLLVLASLGTLFARGATLAYRAMHLSVMMAKGQEIKPKRARRRSSLAMVLRDRPEDDRAGPERQTSAEERRQKAIDDIWKTDYKHPDDKNMHVVNLRDEEDEIQRQKSEKEDEEEEEEGEVEEDVQIPVIGVLLFAFLYICIVAGMLIIWEDWNYFEAFYFSFITLTTIGFGDLVPHHQKNLLAITFFILLGMAIMSMCIALAQDAIMKKVAWASRKIGVAIIKSQPTGK